MSLLGSAVGSIGNMMSGIMGGTAAGAQGASSAKEASDIGDLKSTNAENRARNKMEEALVKEGAVDKKMHDIMMTLLRNI